MKILQSWLIRSIVTGMAMTASCFGNEVDVRAKKFIEYYESHIRPLEIEAAQAYWQANVTGNDEDFRRKQEAEEKIDLCLADPERFRELKSIKDQGVRDPLLARQIDILYFAYLPKQVDKELLKQIIAASNAVEQAFNTFRSEVNGRKLTDNDIRRILRESTDSLERRAAWEASKRVGSVVARDLLKLVALRNEAAQKIGFKNFHALRLYCSEQSQEQLLKLFDELDDLTREPFRAAKTEIDAELAKRYGIATSELEAWHYHDPFFQEAPIIVGELPEEIYKSLDTLRICREFYAGIGLPVDDILARSDLYEKPNKNPHAFCIDIDRRGDVRILENIVPGREWLCTTLHELGHAVYSRNVGAELPYILHTDAHPLCTEGIAMLFERFAQNVDWLAAFGADIPQPERFRQAADRLQRNRLLVFSRYCQVMFRFEMAMYENPEQDLNKLWWDLVEKYQEIRRPKGRNEPDYAAKYHFVGAPAYYHNYMLGEMFASQVHHALAASIFPDKKPSQVIYVGKRAVGEFLKKRVFQPGLSLRWDELTRRATGEPLNAKAFADDFSIKPN